jgi:hypothetical protein
VKELAKHHTGGQLSVAPEHVDDEVLDKMKKPGVESYERFADMFACASRGGRQGPVPRPLLHLGAPGLDAALMVDARALPEEARHAPATGAGLHPHADVDGHVHVLHGQDPFTREPVYTARELRDKRKQKALLLYWDPQHHDLAREALIEAGRRDLIGSAAHCLVPPATGKGALSSRDTTLGRRATLSSRHA